MLHRIAETYGQTPAQQMGVSDPLEAYAVNRACLYAGLNQPEAAKGFSL